MISSSSSSSSYNPLMSVAISKLLEMINRSTYILVYSIATALDSDKNQTIIKDKNQTIIKSMHACHSVQTSRNAPVTRQNRVGFVGEFSWIEYNSVSIRGVTSMTPTFLNKHEMLGICEACLQVGWLLPNSNKGTLDGHPLVTLLLLRFPLI